MGVLKLMRFVSGAVPTASPSAGLNAQQPVQRQVVLSTPERPLSAKVLEMESRVKELLREPHLYDRFFVPVSKVFYSICWGFPASDGHHHPGRLGLIEHSLGVAIRMLRELPVVFGDAVVARDRERVALHCLFAALGHDLGKTMEWVVDSRGYDYSPLTGSVRDQGFTPVVHHNTGRHALLSLSVFTRLLAACPDYLNGRLYDARVLGEVLDAIARHHDSPTENEVKITPYLALLRRADADDAAEDMLVVPAEQEITAREEEIVLEREEARKKQVEIAKRAIRLVLQEAGYGDGWYLTENGWLLVVSPRWVDHEGQGIYQHYTRLLGRESRPYDLWSLLREAGVMLSLDADGKDLRRLKITKPSLRNDRSLYFAAFDETAILDPDAAEKYERYSIRGLAAVLQQKVPVERSSDAKPETVSDDASSSIEAG